MAAIGATRTLPYEWYVDPAVLRLEQERLFGRSWQYGARLDQVAEPGQIATAWAGSLPLVLARDRGGELRGFVNVCRHRGHILCDGDTRRETIQCPYHAWTYELDGSLRSAPRSDREPGFDREALGLRPVSVETWGPFVFVNPDRDAGPLADALGVLPARLAEAGIDVDALRFHSRAESDEYACNWKICAENYLECYHCAVAHPSLVETIDVSPDAYRLEVDGLLSTQIGPRKDSVGARLQPGSHTVSHVGARLQPGSHTVSHVGARLQPGSHTDSHVGARLQPGSHSNSHTKGSYDAEGEIERGQFHFLFPSTVVNVMPGRPNLSIGPIVPREPERTHRFLDYFVGADVDEEWLAGYLALDDAVGAEDRRLVEAVQAGIRSGGLEAGALLPESERLIAHFQSSVVEALGAE